MIEYPAKVQWSKADNCYLVEFPDLPGCLSYGDTLEDALVNAREALTGYLESIDGRKMDIPRPSHTTGKDIHRVAPEKRAAFALWLKLKRAEKGITQQKAASMLNIELQTYQKFENPKKTNPTLSTIARIEEAFGEKIVNL